MSQEVFKERLMDIIRAGLDDTDIFSQTELDYGACCFYAEDKSCRFFFVINGQEATLFADRQQYVDEAIDEFLFYSSFVACVKDPDGRIIRERDASNLELFEIQKIQPSQFYINERKLANCKRWIRSQSNVMIPVSIIGGKTVSLDGHTRLRAALDLGYEYVFVYHDDCGEYITPFVDEAINRNIWSISSMEILSDEEYKVKWHKYCDDFFSNL